MTDTQPQHGGSNGGSKGIATMAPKPEPDYHAMVRPPKRPFWKLVVVPMLIGVVLGLLANLIGNL